MTKPNIIFVLIDSLRADQCLGNEKSSHTEFLDSTRSDGIYFENTFASGDGTIISLNCLLNSKFQFQTGIRTQKIVLLNDNNLQTLKNSGYQIHGLIPELTSFASFRSYLKNKDNSYNAGPPPETLPTGLTEKISTLLKSLKNESPWFCYIHLFDLHPLREGRLPTKIENFQTEKFGNSLYSQTVSSIDHYLKKIFQDIDFENTLLVITADHGERIPFGDKTSFQFEPELKSITKIGRKILPKNTHNVGGKFLGKVKKTVGKAKVEYSNKELTPYQKRSRDPYFTLSLHEELLHIPLFLKGLGLPKKNISNQVSTLDIFPTIFDIVGIPYKKSKFYNSLVPLINNRKIPSLDIFLHTIPYQKESLLDRVGIRTSKFKYFRNSRNSKKDVHLYDLENDPHENNNIAQDNLEMVEKMEDKLSNMQKDSKKFDETLDQKEDEEISKELKKLGYM